MITKILTAPTTWRTVGVAIVGALSALAIQYPAWHWIPVAIAAFSAFGIVVIPSAGQSSAAAAAAATAAAQASQDGS